MASVQCAMRNLDVENHSSENHSSAREEHCC